MFSFSTRRPANSSSAAARKSAKAAEDHAAPGGPANTNSGTGFARAKTGHGLHRQRLSVTHGRDEGHVEHCRHHRVLPAAARTTWRSSKPCGARKTRRFLSPHAAVATWPAPWRHLPKNSAPSQFRAVAPAWPNPSLNRSANGVSPGPVCGAVHSPQPGPGATPSPPG